MKNALNRLRTVVAALLIVVCFGQAVRAEGKKLRVVCTTTMIADLASTIAGDAAEVRGIMRPGEDPHIYDVRPRDVQLIASADVVMINGLHLEATLGAVIENNASRATVVALAVDPRIKPLGSEQTKSAPDPHCWFNVKYFRVYAERARDALIKADPANEKGYASRAAAYFAELDALDAWVRGQVESVPKKRRVMVTSHDAFQYYGQAYDIEVHAVIGISTEQQARPRDLARLESIVRDRGVRALFIETSVSKTLNDLVIKVAESSGAGIGGTLYSDSLGGPGTQADTYLKMVRHNTKTIVEALR
jgi:manganese/zinc/iron transport system substrate-binding protein